MPDRVSHATGGTRAWSAEGSFRRAAVRRAAWLLALSLNATACSVVSPSSAAPKARTPTVAARHSPRSSATGSPSSSSHRTSRPLAGKIVGIDPGHNGLNHTAPAFLAKQIWNGREWEDCNTTGTQTASGYTEALFNFNVATYLAADLRKDGARVVLTRHNNHGLGPCVNRRSAMLNHTDVAIDIHADGGPAWGRGFTVLEPVADGPNDNVIAPSVRFGHDVHKAFLAGTPMRVSDYYGHDGYIFRDDLAGLNLTTVPKVLIECGNMPNAADAALLTTPRVQRRIARALEAAIIRFLTGRWQPGRRSG
ncbi:MAG TPA: N-acetylmuramoyl-L-alanine amidase [Streptosporangiaceae bacterium]|nr:N-acetylmuramoyl-L-alanine amidase [Streptosporangiaceae bacterium]